MACRAQVYWGISTKKALFFEHLRELISCRSDFNLTYNRKLFSAVSETALTHHFKQAHPGRYRDI